MASGLSRFYLRRAARVEPPPCAGKPRGYAFIEFEHKNDFKTAYRTADGKRIEGRRVLVDCERGRTVDNWYVALLAMAVIQRSHTWAAVPAGGRGGSAEAWAGSPGFRKSQRSWQELLLPPSLLLLQNPLGSGTPTGKPLFQLALPVLPRQATVQVKRGMPFFHSGTSCGPVVVSHSRTSTSIGTLAHAQQVHWLCMQQLMHGTSAGSDPSSLLFAPGCHNPAQHVLAAAFLEPAGDQCCSSWHTDIACGQDTCPHFESAPALLVGSNVRECLPLTLVVKLACLPAWRRCRLRAQLAASSAVSGRAHAVTCGAVW
jgi:hypothetical protein